MEKYPVNGIAVRTGLSRNGIKYLPEELKNFAPTLANRPMLKDHWPSTDNTIGLVEKSDYSKGRVFYSGWIKDQPTSEKIDDGRIKEVSIGAIVEKLVLENEEEPEGTLIARGITGLELSTTPVPGVVGTSIKQCLKQIQEAQTPEERVKIKGIMENVDDFRELQEEAVKIKEDEKMAEEEKEKPVDEPQDEPEEEQPKEEPKQDESALLKLIASIEKLTASKATNEELASKVDALEKKLEEQKKTKGKVTTEAKKNGIEVVVENNRYKPGTKNIFAKGSTF